MTLSERPPTIRLTSPPTRSRPNRQLPMILAAGSLTSMTGAVVAPVLPTVLDLFPPSELAWANGLLVSMHCLTIAIFSPLLGLVVDKTAPLRVLIPSLLLYGLSGTAGALLPQFWPLLLTRALLGAASGGIMAACLGWLSKNYEGAERARVIGYASGVLTLSGIIYPLLGGLVGTWQWQYAFLLYLLALPVMGWAWYHRQQHDRARQTNAQASLLNMEELGELLQQRSVLSILATLGLASIVMYTVVIYAPLYLDQYYGVTAQFNGLILAARALGGAITAAWLAKKAMRRIGHGVTAALGFSLMAAMLISIPFLPQSSLILTAAVFFGAGFGLIMPALYDRLASLTPEQMRSTVLAVGTGSGFLGQFIAPVILGPLTQWGALSWVFYGAGAIALLSALFCLRLPSPRTSLKL